MQGNSISKSLLKIGNIIANVVHDRDDFLRVNPDIESSGKITKLMSSFTYTPNIVIDNNLKYMDESKLKDLVKTELLAFSGILLQAFRVLSEIYAEHPNIIVNKMSNHQDFNYGDIVQGQDYINGLESIDYTKDLLEGKGPLPITYGNEDGLRNKETDVVNNTSIQKDTSIFLTTYEVQLTVTCDDGGNRVIVIPVIIYPNIVYTDASSLLNNVLENKHGKGFLDRFTDYRAGLISLSDLIFASDLVRLYKEKKIKNENDFAKYLNKVDKVSSIKDLFYGHNSFHKNFNIYIFDIALKSAIEKTIKGSVFIDRNKNNVTDSLSAFSVTFVDTEAEEVIILLDSIPGFSTLNYNMLKKEKDSEIKDVIKELMKNRQPF